MRAILGLALLIFSTLGLISLLLGEWAPAVGLFALSIGALIPLMRRGSQRIQHGRLTLFALNSLFVIGSLVCVHMLIANRQWDADFTEGGRQSLSPLTERQLRALPLDVQITAISADPVEIRPALERLARQTGRLRYDILHPTRDQIGIRSLARRLGIVNPRAGAIILETSDDRHRVMEAADGLDFVFDEQGWVNALIQLTRTEQPRVVFLLDHGEKNPDLDLVALRSTLQTLAFQVSAGATQSIPDDTALVISAGPVRDFTAADIAALQRHADSGGSVLIMLEPPLGVGNVSAPPLTNLERWIENQGVDIAEGVIAEDDPFVSDQLRITDHRSPLVSRVNDSHPITSGFNPHETLLLMHGAKALDVGDGDGSRERTIENLMITRSVHTWLTPTLSEIQRGDIPSARSLERRAQAVGVAVTSHMPNGAGMSRLVVLGDSDWISDPWMGHPLLSDGALRIARGAIGWLVQEEDLVAIPPRTPPTTTIAVGPLQRRLMSVLAVLLIPELLLALGIWLVIARSEDERERRLAPMALALLFPLCLAVGIFSLGYGLTIVAVLALLCALVLCPLMTVSGVTAEVKRLSLMVSGAVLIISLLIWVFPSLRSLDVGAGRVHPLSPIAMASLDRDVDVALIDSGDTRTESLMERLSPLTPHLHWQTLDPNEDIETIAGIAQEWDIAPPEPGSAIVMGGSGLRQGPTAAKIVPPSADEERWVNALIDIGRRNPTRLVLTSGHGERDLSTEMFNLERLFLQLGIEAEQRPLEDGLVADVIMIAGPTQDFTAQEINLLNEHVERNGSIIALLDSPIASTVRNAAAAGSVTPLPNLTEWLENRWSLDIPEAIIIDDDPQLASSNLRLSPIIGVFDPTNPVSARTAADITATNSPLMLLESRPILIRNTTLQPNQDARVIMATQSSAWAESDLNMLLQGDPVPNDRPKMSLSVAVAARIHHPDRSARLLIIGDSDFATDARQQRVLEMGLNPLPMQRLLRSMLGWVVPEGNRVTFADPAQRVALGSDLQAANARHRARTALLIALLLLGATGLSLRRGRSLIPITTAIVVTLPLALWMSQSSARGPEFGQQESIIAIPRSQITEMTIMQGEEVLSLQRQGTSWRLPDGRMAQGADLLSRALSTRMRHSVQPTPAGPILDALGLEDPLVILNLVESDGSETTLKVGDIPGRSHRRLWAQVEGEDVIFTLDDSIATLLRRPLSRWQTEETP